MTLRPPTTSASERWTNFPPLPWPTLPGGTMPDFNPTLDRLLDVETIYPEPSAPLYDRGREILARFPDARRIVVASHWNIPGLHGNEGAAEDWLRIKKAVLVLGVRKS